jgi:tetratricopeptide (TPR) repeat protein
MKKFIIVYLTLLTFLSQGQEIKSKLTGAWILTSRVYKSGAELPPKLTLKDSYFRFEFNDSDKVNKSFNPLNKGWMFDYSIDKNILKIGFVNYRIELLTKDSLILLEQSKGEYDESAIKYSFVSESLYQESIPLTADMLIISSKDTIYLENEKINAHFENPDSFEDYISTKTSQYVPTGIAYFFMATFIVNADGSIDSIKIHKSLNKIFDNHFIEAVKKSEVYWKPAYFHGKNVKTLHQTVFIHFTIDDFYERITNYADGIIFMEQGIFLKAITSFKIYLDSNPGDVDAIYHRGLAYYRLNDLNDARNDWNKIKNQKFYKSNMLIKQLCE